MYPISCLKALSKEASGFTAGGGPDSGRLLRSLFLERLLLLDIFVSSNLPGGPMPGPAQRGSAAATGSHCQMMIQVPAADCH